MVPTHTRWLGSATAAARPASSGSARASRATNTAPPRAGPISASAWRHSEATRSMSPSMAGRTPSTTGLGGGAGLQLVDPVQDRLAPARGGLVGPHRLQLLGAEAGQALHHLRGRQRVVAG